MKRYFKESFLYSMGYSCVEISNIMGLSEWSVRDRLHKEGIKTDRYKRSVALLTDRQKEILDGEMLGDGCLCIGSENKNARLQWNLKKLEHVRVLANEFYGFNPSFRRRRDRDGWSLHTGVNEDLTRQYHRWYSEYKTVPKDLLFTPLVCFHWYVGDGYYRKPYGGLELYTFAFCKEDCEFLVEKFDNLGIVAKILFKKGRGLENYIAIGKKSAKLFLEYIGPPRLNCYKYKWG